MTDINMNKSGYMGMHRITTKQAAAELGIGVDSLQYLMQDNRLPIGFVTKRKKGIRHTYYIFRESLDSYLETLKAGAAFPNAPVTFIPLTENNEINRRLG